MWCWASFMGHTKLDSVNAKDTVWWREQWKAATNAPRHAADPSQCRKYWQQHAKPGQDAQRFLSRNLTDGENEEKEEEEEDEDEEEEAEEEDDDEEEGETPAWVQRTVDILWKHGGGNMKWTTLQQKAGLSGVSQHAALSRPEFECCGRGNHSVRLVSSIRLQRYK
ncbi:unnamed protein product [Symbiodinium natans]|uniref:Uncharacterized protein n=1 Tax=Symbiodinium natans TaxID=878477 RepID=A0A812UJQ4_9DINO|nr:unnamed protein product [Symbiodinium natans]